MQNSGESVSGNADNFYVINGNYLTVQYIWTHDTNRTNFLLNGAHHFLLEYSLVSERYSTDGTHGEHMSINNSGSNAETIIRHNIFRNSTNTGTIVIKDSVQSGFKIYGNLFYTTNYSRYYNTNGIIADTTGDTTTDVEVYNNTFLRMQNGGGKPTRVVAFRKSTGNVFFNNIVLGSGGISGVSTRGYNLYDKLELANGEGGGQYFSAEPSVLFRNPSLHDYALRIPTNNGKGLINEEYLTDMLLKTRGKDGVLDRGCFEFDGNVEYDSETIPAPKSLRLQN